MIFEAARAEQKPAAALHAKQMREEPTDEARGTDLNNRRLDTALAVHNSGQIASFARTLGQPGLQLRRHSQHELVRGLGLCWLRRSNAVSFGFL